MITCDKMIEKARAIPKNFNEEKIKNKTKSVYILLTFFVNYHSIIDNY